MKIEKVNDHQIRCTLTREDLAQRQLKVSELAYGTEKARELFQEMMKQANNRFGFNAEDVPLMIEAIPINSECIILVITKSEETDELSNSISKDVTDDEATFEKEEIDFSEEIRPDEEVMDLFKRLQEGDFSGFLDGATANSDTNNVRKRRPRRKLRKSDNEFVFSLFRFSNMHEVIKISKIVVGDYSGHNTLFKDPDTGSYFIAVYGNRNDKTYEYICRILDEYAQEEVLIPYSIGYLNEHYSIIIEDYAIQKLARAL